MKNEENLKNFGQILRHRRQELGFTLDQLAAATHISKPYLSNIETGRAPGPASDEKLTRLEGALGFAVGELVQQAAWLRTPESVRAMLGKQESGSRNQERERGGIMDVTMVPLINKVAAGEAAEYTDLDYPVGVADAYLPVPVGAEEVGVAAGQEMEAGVTLRKATVFALRVEGDSMLPEYRAGDIVVVSTREALPGEDCLVRLGAEENFATTLKRIYFEPAEGAAEAVRLVPLNGKFAQRVVALERVTGIYPVVWKVMKVESRK